MCRADVAGAEHELHVIRGPKWLRKETCICHLLHLTRHFRRRPFNASVKQGCCRGPEAQALGVWTGPPWLAAAWRPLQYLEASWKAWTLHGRRKEQPQHTVPALWPAPQLQTLKYGLTSCLGRIPTFNPAYEFEFCFSEQRSNSDG